MDILHGVLLLVAVIGASCLATISLIFLYRQKGFVDSPNERSSHTKPTITGGGLALVIVLGICVFLSYLFELFSLHLTLFLSTAFVMALIGWVDDNHGLSPRFRLLAQTILAFPLSYLLLQCFTGQLSKIELILAIFVLVFFFVWFVNLFNFMDGIDGLAIVEALSIIAGILVIVSFSGATPFDYDFLPLWLLLASMLGFLFFNFPRAYIFLGDVGSLFLGWCLVLLAVWYTVLGYTNLWSWWVLMGVFIVDASLMLGVKLLKGQPLSEPHKNHVYQQLAEYFSSHVVVTLGVLTINLVWLLPWAYLAHNYAPLGMLIMVVSWSPLILIAILIHRFNSKNRFDL